MLSKNQIQKYYKDINITEHEFYVLQILFDEYLLDYTLYLGIY